MKILSRTREGNEHQTNSAPGDCRCLHIHFSTYVFSCKFLPVSKPYINSTFINELLFTRLWSYTDKKNSLFQEIPIFSDKMDYIYIYVDMYTYVQYIILELF